MILVENSGENPKKSMLEIEFYEVLIDDSDIFITEIQILE